MIQYNYNEIKQFNKVSKMNKRKMKSEKELEYPTLGDIVTACFILVCFYAVFITIYVLG
jgi:hypothetical protein